METLNLPSISASVHPDVRRAFTAIKTYFGGLEREGGVATKRYFEDRGFQSTPPPSVAAPPPAPVGFEVFGLFNQILLQWGGYPSWVQVSHTTIYRAEVDDFGQAVAIAQVGGGVLIYSDTPPISSISKTYWYWIRHTNIAGEGPLNRAEGTPGATADDPGYIREILAGKVTSSELHESLNSRINLIDAPGTGLLDRLLSVQSQMNSLAGEIAGAVFVQPTTPVPGVDAPDPMPENARWYDSDDNNHPYIWNGGQWHDLADPRIGQSEAEITSLKSRMTSAEGGLSANTQAISTLETTTLQQGNTLTSQAGQITTLSTQQQTMTKEFQSVMDEDVSQWQKYTGAGELTVVSASDAQSGSKILRIGNNSGDDSARVVHKAILPFDPNAIYRITIRARRTAGSGTLFAGFAGVAADGTTLVNSSGANNADSQHYHAAFNVAPGSAWTEWTGYTKGFGASAGTTAQAQAIASPGQMHPSVRYLRPYLLANYNGVAGITEVDLFKVEILTGEIQTHSTSIQTLTTTTDGLKAQHTLKIDNNGFLSGFGLASDVANGTPFSAFEFLADRFAIVNPNVTPIAISSITRSSTTATVTTAVNHGRTTGDFVVITGASPSGYNGTKQITVTSATTFTFICSSSLTTPATIASGFSAMRVGHAFVPFIVQDGKVIMSEALIGALTVGRAAIKDLAVDNAKIADLSVAKLLAGVITASNIFLGAESRVHLDGQNNRIVVTDANNTIRVILGKLAGGYGIEIYDASGTLILGSGGGIPRRWATPGNLLSNALPHASATGDRVTPTDWGVWATGEYTDGVDYTANVNLHGADWHIPNEYTPAIWQRNGTTTGFQYLYFLKNGGRFPIVTGKRYEVHAHVNLHRCDGTVGIEWYNAAGQIIDRVFGTRVAGPSVIPYANALSGFAKIGNFFTAPANAAFCIPIIVKYGTWAGQPDSHMFVTRAYFGEAGADQADLSPWSPGLHAGGPVSAANISTYIAGAAIGAAQIGNAAVGTLHLQGEAVVVSAAATLASDYRLPVGYWVSLLSCSLNNLGQPIILHIDVGRWAWHDPSYANAGGHFRVLVNGAELPGSYQQIYAFDVNGSTTYQNDNPRKIYRISSAANVTTVEIQFYISGSSTINWTFFGGQNTIVGMGIKR